MKKKIKDKKKILTDFCIGTTYIIKKDGIHKYQHIGKKTKEIDL